MRRARGEHGFLKRLILVLLVLVVLVYGVIFSVNNNQTVVLDLWLVKLPPFGYLSW